MYSDFCDLLRDFRIFDRPTILWFSPPRRFFVFFFAILHASAYIAVTFSSLFLVLTPVPGLEPIHLRVLCNTPPTVVACPCCMVGMPCSGCQSLAERQLQMSVNSRYPMHPSAPTHSHGLKRLQKFALALTLTLTHPHLVLFVFAPRAPG